MRPCGAGRGTPRRRRPSPGDRGGDAAARCAAADRAHIPRGAAFPAVREDAARLPPRGPVTGGGAGAGARRAGYPVRDGCSEGRTGAGWTPAPVEAEWKPPAPTRASRRRGTPAAGKTGGTRPMSRCQAVLSSREMVAPVRTLHVVSQHQFHGEGVEEELACQVSDGVLPDVMADQGDGHHEGNESPPIQID